MSASTYPEYESNDRNYPQGKEENDSETYLLLAENFQIVIEIDPSFPNSVLITHIIRLQNQHLELSLKKKFILADWT